MPDRLDDIRARLAAATPGPWEWHGDVDTHDVYLSTVRFGRQLVMGFRRWGMNGAAPQFVDGRTWRPNPECGADFPPGAVVRRVDELTRYEVAPDAETRQDPRVYRGTVRGIRNPDATFIAASRADVEWLVAEVDWLRGEADA